MAKYTDKQITLARAIYESGESLREASRQTDIPEATLRRYAKNESWECGKWRTQIEQNTNSLKTIVDNDALMAQNMTQLQKQLTDKIIERKLDIKQYAEDTQFEILDVMRKAAQVANKFIADNPSGQYVKAQTDKGTTFGLVTEVIPHLSPVLNGATAIIKDDKPQTAIQINTNEQVKITATNAIDASRAYQDLINDD